MSEFCTVGEDDGWGSCLICGLPLLSAVTRSEPGDTLHLPSEAAFDERLAAGTIPVTVRRVVLADGRTFVRVGEDVDGCWVDYGWIEEESHENRGDA